MFSETPVFVIPPPDTGHMSTAQLTIVNIDPASPAVSRYRLDDRTRQLGQVGLASARAILAEAAARREAAANHDHAHAA
jgi:hypothetical protein